MKKLITIIILLSYTQLGFSQNNVPQNESFPAPSMVFKLNKNTYKRKIKVQNQLFKKNQNSCSTFNVDYIGFTPEAQVSFQEAVNYWSNTMSSPVPIRIKATMEVLPSGVIGSARSGVLYRNTSGIPILNMWYPVALANKYNGSDLDISGASSEGGYDIIASFSSNFSFYFGNDGNVPANKIDFISVVLHEIGHGLGMSGSFGTANIYGGGFPMIFSNFVQHGSNNILSYPNPSTALSNALISNNLFWNGANAVTANAGNRPLLFAPSPWQSGSSYSHLNESTYPAGNPNALFTPSIAMGEFIHDAGAIGIGILQDIGWTVCSNNIQSNLIIKDNPADTGLEPNNTTVVMWDSPDIWVRQNNDDGTTNQAAEYKASTPNYVYVRVTNNGTSASGSGKIRLYYNKAATGSDWPTHWDNYNCGTAMCGDEITDISSTDSFINGSFSSISAGGTHIVKIKWNVPNPANFSIDQNHFCLLARIETVQDPMTTLEGTNVWINVSANNNIAQKNVSVYDIDPTNLIALEKPLWLNLRTGNNVKGEKTKVKINIDPALFDNGTVKLIANEKIKASLVKSKLTGIKAITSPKTTIIRGTSNAAFLTLDSKTSVIENLDLKENDENVIGFTFEPKIKNLAKNKSYYIDIVHYGTDKKTGKEVIIGGERIQINYFESNKKNK
jgi:hypothetical protein